MISSLKIALNPQPLLPIKPGRRGVTDLHALKRTECLGVLLKWVLGQCRRLLMGVRVVILFAALVALPGMAMQAYGQKAALPPADFYVAPGGDDTWSGTLAAPNAAKADGPFATVDRARQAVQQLRRSGKHVGAFTVVIRGGTYFLRQPLLFTAEDTGMQDSPVVYQAAPGERVTLSGGVRIGGWKQNAKGAWTTTVADVQRGQWTFSQLWANETRRMRPRLPKNTYYSIDGSLSPSPRAEGKGFDRFKFNPGEIKANWSNPHDVEALCFQTWTMARLRVDSVDETKNIVTLLDNTRGLAAYSGLPKGNRYILENVKEALTEPGEWYLDRPTGVLTYLPLPGETPDKTTLIAPQFSQLVQLVGNKDSFVQYVTFRDIGFAHTNWNLPPDGKGFAQAEVNVDAAISLIGARNCAFENCRVEHTGNYAFELGKGCKYNRIENCILSDLGAGGVKIGEQGIERDINLLTSNNSVRNCLIARGGRVHPAAVGVWIGHSPFNQIEHNAIVDFYYTGISLGWSWGYGPSACHDNHISDNRIAQIGQGVLSDMGGIYTLGLNPGTVLERNVISDVHSFDYGGWGIYFDEGTSDITARDNIVYRTKTGGLHQHYGQNNRVVNNIFAFSEQAQLIRTRPEDHLSFTIEHNIIYDTQPSVLGSNWTGNGKNFALDYNDYWNTGGGNLIFGGKTFADWQQLGQDVHSQVADPQFVSPETGDFRLKPGSPAEKIGFKPIDVTQVGPQPENNPAGTTEGGNNAVVMQARQAVQQEGAVPAALRAFPPPPPPAPPAPIADGFEEGKPGDKAADATTSEENATATLRVTNETAHTGKQSLKFVDAPGQKFGYNPHLFYSPNYMQGTATASFALRVEPGFLLTHEWRDNANPYHVGPSLRIDGQGNLTANGQKVATLPPGQWVTFDITCGLGNKANGKYDLTVHLPNQATPIHLANLPCSPEFRSLTWFGFSAEGTQAAVGYLDDLALSVRQ